MKLKIFTLPFDPSINGFNDAVIEKFAPGKELISVSDHFFIHENRPYLSVIVTYREIAPDEARHTQRRNDPRTELDENERVLFDALRKWRSEKAKAEGVPPYLICNNRQLAKIVKLRPKSKAALTMVNGIGETKAEHYGDEIISTMNRNPNTEEDEKK